MLYNVRGHTYLVQTLADAFACLLERLSIGWNDLVQLAYSVSHLHHTSIILTEVGSVEESQSGGVNNVCTAATKWNQ